MDTCKAIERGTFREAASNINPAGLINPEFIRIPRPKEVDPVFGLNRSYWYRLEREGKIRFHRIRPAGKEKGICLISVPEAREMVHRLIQEGEQ